MDAERDKLFDDLRRTGDLSNIHIESGFHPVRAGKNGEGNPWHTDGDLYAGWIRPTADEVTPDDAAPAPGEAP